MILIITNSEDKTVDYLNSRLNVPSFRFDTDNFITDYEIKYTLDNFTIKNKVNQCRINNNELSGILYRRPVNPKVNIENNQTLSDELAIEARLFYEYSINNLNVKWMSHPNNTRIAEDKILQLKTAKTIGFNVPDTIITNSHNELVSFIQNDKPYCIKPLYLGVHEINGNNFIPYNSKLEKSDDLTLVNNFPALIQEYIEKEYELRIIVVGNDLFAIKIDSQNNIDTQEDWRVNNCLSVPYSLIELPEEIKVRCKKIVEQFNLNFSSMDLIYSKTGDYYFLDLNPNGQWAWIDEILNLNISKSIGEFFYGKK